MFNLKQLIVFTLVILVWGGGSRCSIAQDSEKAHVFKSRPNGAIVQLIGSYTIIGQTPLFISHDLNGMYQIKVTKPGYESWKKQMMFYSGLENEFDIQLPP
ncbi:PEGA domain-containing protein, partial [candidate division KSB1 bacterium]|nr:PEGA domain-containing protein [candidate division KSB1 bacterium]